jgi:hypothetical protein
MVVELDAVAGTRFNAGVAGRSRKVGCRAGRIVGRSELVLFELPSEGNAPDERHDRG